MKIHLAAVRALHVDFGLEDPLLGTPRLDKLMTGVRRELGDSVRVKLPITTDILARMRPLMKLHTADDRMWWAAMRLATCGLLRTGEIAPDSATSDRVPTCADLSFERFRLPRPVNIINFRLRESKTDQFRQSVNVTIADTATVYAVSSYLQLRRQPRLPTSALFMLSDGTTLTRAALLTKCRNLLANLDIDLRTYAGISFRRGGATSLALAGVDEPTIQHMGRWRSDCYKRYIARPRHIAVSAGLRM